MAVTCGGGADICVSVCRLEYIRPVHSAQSFLLHFRLVLPLPFLVVPAAAGYLLSVNDCLRTTSAIVDR